MARGMRESEVSWGAVHRVRLTYFESNEECPRRGLRLEKLAFEERREGFRYGLRFGTAAPSWMTPG